MGSPSRFIQPVAATLIVIVLVGGICAGEELASMTGRVLDSKGSPIPAAAVRLVCRESEFSTETLTAEDGTFRFVEIPAGSFEITVEMQGFQKLAYEGSTLDPNAERELRLTMRSVPSAGSRPLMQGAGRAAAPSPGRARPANPAASFPEVLPSDFPGSGQLPDVTPGAMAVQPGAAGEPGSELLLVAGSPGLTFDAIDWNDPRMRERMMEGARQMGFRIMENQAQGPGRGMAGMRSGGGPMGGPMGGGPMFLGPGAAGRGARLSQSRINGSADFRYANSALNARPYSLSGEELAAPLQIANSFGIAVGGVLPWTSGSTARRTQGGPMRGMAGRRRGSGWFFSYSGSRNRSPFDALSTVPTELERSGDFSLSTQRSGLLAGNPVVIYDPLAPVPTPFPDNRIPMSRIDPASRELLKYIPSPNLPGPVQNFTMQRGLVDTNDQLGLRLNSGLGAGHNINISYNYRRGGSISSQIFPGLDAQRTNRAHNAMIGGMYRGGQRLMVNYRLSFNWVRALGINDFAYEKDVAGDLGISGVSRDPINYGVPAIRFTNYGDLNLASPSLNQTQAITIGGSVVRIGSKHTVRIGADLAWNQRNIQTDRNPRGTFDYTGFATSAFDTEGRPVAGTGYDLADFLLGFPYSSSRQYGSGRTYLRGKNLNVFFQDDWRASARLTINFGFRYEYVQPFIEKNDHMANLDVAGGFTAVAAVLPGEVGPYSGPFPRSLVASDKNNLGPRLGIAWKPRVSSRWVFRAGYGIFYNPSVYAYIYGQLIQQPPFAISQDILSSLSNPLTLQQGFPDQPGVRTYNTYAIDREYRMGQVQQWNMDVQTELFRLYTVSVGYNGSRGARLDVLRAPNRAPEGSSPIDTEGNRNIADAGNFVYQNSEASSILHALQARMGRRFSRGFRFQASYTLAKSIDNASGIGGGSMVVVQDEGNIGAERALSSFDQRHRFEFNCNFELPFGERRRFFPNANAVMQQLIAGWNLDAAYQLFSGMPLAARLMGNVSNNSGTGSNYSERPDATGLEVLLPDGLRSTSGYVNPLAFAIPPPGRFGNAGRNTIPGPGTSLLNLSLRKSFRLDDSNRRADFRWTINNAINHPNWSGVATVINAINFGRITGVRPMRSMEFSLRFNF